MWSIALLFIYPVLNFRCFRTRRWVKEKVYLMLNRSNALSFISVSLKTIIYPNHKSLQLINFHTNRGGQPYLTHGTIRRQHFKIHSFGRKLLLLDFNFPCVISVLTSEGWNLHFGHLLVVQGRRLAVFIFTGTAHYRDLIMSAMASKINSLTIVYSTVYTNGQ